MTLIPTIAISIYIIYLLRKLLDTPQRLPNWDKVLSKVWIASIIFLAISFYPPISFIGFWYNKLAYVIVFIALYLLRNFRPPLFDSSKSVSTDKVYALANYYPARPLLIAVIPLGAVYLINNGLNFWSPQFFQKNSLYFSNALGVASLWMLGFGIYAVIQLKKEKKLRITMQEEVFKAAARKAELEQLVTERTNQLVVQNEKLYAALHELKTTQAQLVQSEKMASLGELTAGIAHEIQNPLNFVNNFSEVSAELIREMVDEVEKGNTDEVKAIANDLILNLEKINHHGQRAADIVKGMLQHSRSSSGQKEPTDINALCDEYLRLSYHGLRAKDKSFNATMNTDFDETIGNINIIPQDIGRVILNLINNAFYVVNEKKHMNIPDYEPTVLMSTKKTGDNVEIKVSDNGNGIPQKILDKIFQPFFTTKPTGQGTGLGLSLSYDIIKAHGGEIKVKNKEGEGTTLIIQLPVV